MAGKVPETILKKRRRNDEWAAKQAAAAAEAAKKAKANRQLAFKKAQAYATEYLKQVGSSNLLCGGTAAAADALCSQRDSRLVMMHGVTVLGDAA